MQALPFKGQWIQQVYIARGILYSTLPHYHMARTAHLSNASSNVFPDSIILCWASLCRRVSAGVAPIRTMASPTWSPHFAAKLPGVTYKTEAGKHQSFSASDRARSLAACRYLALCLFRQLLAGLRWAATPAAKCCWRGGGRDWSIQRAGTEMQ